MKSGRESQNLKFYTMIILEDRTKWAKRPTFGINKMDNRFVLEDVDLFNPWNDVDSESLQSALQPLVISCSRLVDGFLLPANEMKVDEEGNKRVYAMTRQIKEEKKNLQIEDWK